MATTPRSLRATVNLCRTRPLRYSREAGSGNVVLGGAMRNAATLLLLGAVACGDDVTQIDAGIIDGGQVDGGPDAGLPPASCGDGQVDPPEECDNGSANDDSVGPCSTLCRPAVYWTRTWGAPDHEQLATGVATDSDDNIVVVGFAGVDGQSSNAFVRKYSPAGDDLWTRTYNDDVDGIDQALAVAVDLFGSIVVVGYHTELGPIYTWWMRKYDPAGVELWSRTGSDAPAIPNGEGDARAVAIDSFGNIVVVGADNPTPSTNETLIRKHDIDGAVMWTRTYLGPGAINSGATDVAVDSATGRVVAVGYDQDAGGNYSGWVREYDADGAESWSATILGGSTEWATGVAINEQGQALVSSSTGLRLYSLVGDLMWSVATPSYAKPDGVAVDGPNSYLCGRANIAGAYDDIWVAKYGPTGSLIWERGEDGPASYIDQASAVAVDHGGRVIAAGSESVSITPYSSIVWVRTYGP